jgi:hypothetical protein
VVVVLVCFYFLRLRLAAVLDFLARQPDRITLVVECTGNRLLDRVHITSGHVDVPAAHAIGVVDGTDLDNRDEERRCDHEKAVPPDQLCRGFEVDIEVVVEVQTEPISHVEEDEEDHLEEQVVVVDADAVHDHAAVVIVFDAASVALTAVVHARKFENFAAFLAIFELSLVLHAEIYKAIWQVIIVENHRVKIIFCAYLKRNVLHCAVVDQLCVLLEPLQFFLQSLEALVEQEFLHGGLNSAGVTEGKYEINEREPAGEKVEEISVKIFGQPCLVVRIKHHPKQELMETAGRPQVVPGEGYVVREVS